MAEKAHSNVSGSMRRDAMPVGRAVPPNYGYDSVGPVSGAANIEYWPVDEMSGSSDSDSFPRKRLENSVRRAHGFATQVPPELRNNSSREKRITVGGEGPWPDAPERNRFEKQQRSGSSSQPTVSRGKGGYPSIEAALQRPTTSNPASSGKESYLSKPLPSLISGARSLSLKGRHTASLGPAGGNDDSGRGLSKVVPNAKKALEKRVLEDVLGIYPAENKLPPGRSAADNFVASIARRFGRKNNTPREDSTSDSKATVQTDDYYQPWSPDSVATGPPVVGGVFIAELPGSEVRPPIARSSSRGSVSSYHDRDQSISEAARGGSRSQSLPRAAGRPVVGRFTENTYTNPSPLRAHSAAGRHPSTEMRGTDRRTTEDTAYDMGIAEWAESFYSGPRLSENPSPVIQAPQPGMNQMHRASVLDPEGAVHGEALSLQHSRSSSSTSTSTSRSCSQPHSRSSSLSTVRSSSSRGRSFPRTPTAPASLDSGGRTSHAASIDAFQYEFYDTGLGTIGEDDGFYGGTNGIHNVNGLMGAMRLDDKMGYDHDRGYRNSLYEESSDDFQMELEVEAMLAARREKLLAGKARAPVIPPKCALDLEIEAYLTERKKAAQSVEEK